MNKQDDEVEIGDSGELDAHYEFDYSKAKPNRFAARLAQDRLMVVLDPDIAVVFPTSEAVNDALRVLAAAAKNLPDRKAETPTQAAHGGSASGIGPTTLSHPLRFHSPYVGLPMC